MKLNQKLIATVITAALGLDRSKGALYSAIYALAVEAVTIEGFKEYVDNAREGLVAKGGNPGSLKQYALWIKDEMLAADGDLDNVKTSGDANKRYKERHPGKKGAKAPEGPTASTAGEGAKVDGESATLLHRIVKGAEALFASEPDLCAATLERAWGEVETALEALKAPKGNAEAPKKRASK